MIEDIKTKAKRTINIINVQIDELKTIRRRIGAYTKDRLAKESLERWKFRTARLLFTNVNPDEAKKFKDKPLEISPLEVPGVKILQELSLYSAFLRALRNELRQHPEDLLSPPAADNASKVQSKVRTSVASRTVFIIYGHDKATRLNMESLLRDRWKLNPIVLSSEAGKGRTIIEKFEDEAQPACFAFALLTPDDLIQNNDTEYAQPRPNVIFELGWFYGRLGRNRVCILLKEGTIIHSDLDGISRIEFKKSISEKITEIENELQEARLLKKA